MQQSGAPLGRGEHGEGRRPPHRRQCSEGGTLRGGRDAALGDHRITYDSPSSGLLALFPLSSSNTKIFSPFEPPLLIATLKV